MYGLDIFFKDMRMGENFEYRWKDVRLVCILDQVEYELVMFLFQFNMVEFLMILIGLGVYFLVKFLYRVMNYWEMIEKDKVFGMILLVIYCQMVII